jgi:glycosyltransferase involved in cell wall biosynthesis
MHILFITNLSGVKSLGPSWSVPARIKAQEGIEDVLWVNCTDAYLEHWSEVKCYHNLSEFGGKLTLKSFPIEYQKPDIVVFEDFYYPNCIKFHFELLKKKIPYIIVPRGALTSFAQKSKWLKKKVANFLMFSHFLKKALCIQYLTNEEYKDSTDKWNKRHIIIPNGFKLPENYREVFSKDHINAVFIGRLNAYHKGLDMLIDALKMIESPLRQQKFKVTLYGERNRNYDQLKQQVETNRIEDIVSFGGEAFDEDKAKVLLNADLFIMTSRFEGLPMGLLEALAYGIPVVVTPGTNMAAVVNDANAGWVAEPTVNSIADTIWQAVRCRAEYEQKGKNARVLAIKYDWNILAQTFHKEVEKLID